MYQQMDTLPDELKVSLYNHKNNVNQSSGENLPTVTSDQEANVKNGTGTPLYQD